MRARTGARTTCSCAPASTCWMSRSDSGSTSQNVSVQSKGVCAIEQKLAYVRGLVSPVSSGTIVKLTCLRSDMSASLSSRGASVLAQHSDNDALDLYLFRGHD